MSRQQFSLEGKTAVLTGAAGFFGRHFTRAFLDSGARVVLIDRAGEFLTAFGEELQAAYGPNRASVVRVDLYDRAAAAAAFRTIADSHPPDILVNNAFDFSSATGFNVPEGRFECATYDQFRACFDAGVYWAFHATQVIGGEMRRLGSGSIINIGTMYADAVPNPSLYGGTAQFNPWGYSASKGALLQLTRSSAAQLAPKVRVNMISPGAIPNLENTHTSNPPDPRVSDRLLGKILLRRMGHPHDLTGGLIFLASDASRYITGQNLKIDGGITVTVT